VTAELILSRLLSRFSLSLMNDFGIRSRTERTRGSITVKQEKIDTAVSFQKINQGKNKSREQDGVCDEPRPPVQAGKRMMLPDNASAIRIVRSISGKRAIHRIMACGSIITGWQHGH